MTLNQEVSHAIEIRELSKIFGHTDAVNGLSLTVEPGRCYGLFGRNGAGKTTTIKCLLGHLKPSRGKVRVFGMDPRRDEVGVKRHIGYVPETMGFYPWMTARNMLDYAASFRPSQWTRALERDLIGRFGLDPKKKINVMSKGMRAQLSLICAIAAEPDLLLLDEPTSGLDPIVRREFIETVIGAFQEADPQRRTVFVSTHLISEWEGLIDEFTIVEQGRARMSLEADHARARYRRIRLRFAGDPPALATGDGIIKISRDSHSLNVFTDNYNDALMERLRALNPEAIDEDPLSLEEIFVALGQTVEASLT
jgi:ABC-2 type transport system ATP-binding protein